MVSDFAIYGVHGGFWTVFGITDLWAKRGSASATASAAPKAEVESTAPHSRALLAFHTVAFAVMYFGLGNAIIPNRVPFWFTGQRVAGTLVIASGAGLMSWARAYFRSWRFRAKLDADHELATGGPFALVRHPIYGGLNLLALGSAIWVPTIPLWIAVVVMVIGSDLRGRAEERLLEGAFGQRYRDYCRKTKRFIPRIY